VAKQSFYNKGSEKKLFWSQQGSKINFFGVNRVCKLFWMIKSISKVKKVYKRSCPSK